MLMFMSSIWQPCFNWDYKPLVYTLQLLITSLGTTLCDKEKFLQYSEILTSLFKNHLS